MPETRVIPAAPSDAELDPRIEIAADMAQIRTVCDERDWRNPLLSLKQGDVWLRSASAQTARLVPLSDLRRTLVRLPIDDWPYGRMVGVPSLETLRAQAVNDVAVLAYPNGDHTSAVAAAAMAAGYHAAVTTLPGLEGSRPADPFRLKRIGLHDDVTQSVPRLALHVAREARSGMTRTPAC